MSRTANYLNNVFAVAARAAALFYGEDDVPALGSIGELLRARVTLVSAGVVLSTPGQERLALFARIDDGRDIVGYSDAIGGPLWSDRPMTREELDRVLHEAVFGLWEELASGQFSLGPATTVNSLIGFNGPFD